MRMKIIVSASALLLVMSGVGEVLAQKGVNAISLSGKPKYKNIPGEYLSYASKNAKQGGELKLMDSRLFDSFNPFLEDVNRPAGLNLVYETLTSQTLDEPFTAYGHIAERIELAKNKLSVTFYINKNARFQDGSFINAQDVKASFETAVQLSPRTAQYYRDVKEVIIKDIHTIRFNFKRINPELHMILGGLTIFKSTDLDKENISKRQLVPFIGSGPYKIKNYKMGQYIVYEKINNYWGSDLLVNRGKYNFNRVRYVAIKDSTARLEAFKAGEFDIRNFNSAKEWASFTGEKVQKKLIVKKNLPHENNQGMQALIFNLRKPIFKDIRVREALNLAFNFPWTNKNIFYSQYTRSKSYYSNSELGAKGLPSEEELKLLEPLKAMVPETVFNEPMGVEVSRFEEEKNYHRKRLRRAVQLLNSAGWKTKRGVLQKNGEPFQFEILLWDPLFKRIVEPYLKNLQSLGIGRNQVSYRVVDLSLWQKKLFAFDFDMVTMVIPQSNSPGNEQRFYFHSSQANVKNSNNFSGFTDPAVDALIDKIITAPDRKSLITATHSLDRVLMKNFYLIPSWHITHHRVAYWDKFGIPAWEPKYYSPSDWWFYWWLK